MTPLEPQIQCEDLRIEAPGEGPWQAGLIACPGRVSSRRYARARSVDFHLWALVARARAQALEALGRDADAARIWDLSARWREQGYWWQGRE